MASDAILLERMDISEPALKSAIQLQPDDYIPYVQLGGLYLTDNRFALVGRGARQVVKLDTNRVPGHVLLGLALEELGDPEGAVRAYRRAIELTERRIERVNCPISTQGRLA